MPRLQLQSLQQKQARAPLQSGVCVELSGPCQETTRAEASGTSHAGQARRSDRCQTLVFHKAEWKRSCISNEAGVTCAHRNPESWTRAGGGRVTGSFCGHFLGRQETRQHRYSAAGSLRCRQLLARFRCCHVPAEQRRDGKGHRWWISFINRATVATEQRKYLLLSGYNKTPSVFSKRGLVLLNFIVK